MQTRRFVYVKDLAEGVVARARARGREPRLQPRRRPRTSTVREIAEIVRDDVGDVEIVHTPGRNGDFSGAEISGARAEVELGWRPKTSFAEGVRRYYEWYLAEHDVAADAV